MSSDLGFFTRNVDIVTLLFVITCTILFAFRLHTGRFQPASSLAPINATAICERLIENYSAWIIVYGTVFFFLYGPTRNVFAVAKINPEYPTPWEVIQEVMWSAMTVGIATIWQIGTDCAVGSQEVQLGSNDILLGLLLYVCAEVHFYVQHRLMHHPFLYQRFHKIHHRSQNTNPWSGLSFHPVEAVVYFSPTALFLLMPSLFAPLTCRLLHFSLLLLPSRGHHGFRSLSGTNPEHYIHHVKFNYNFGASLGLDTYFGTSHYTRSE